MSGYIGPQPVPQAIQFRQKITLTNGQTSVATKGYFPGYTDVFMNGVRLVDGDDYTATNGTDIVLATGAVSGDVLEYVTLSPFQLVDQIFKGLTTAEKLSLSGQLDMPQWTTATRPTSPRYGTTGYNTELKALENYTDQGWLKVSVPIPIVTSVTGNIYSGLSSTITMNGLNFGSGVATATFTSGQTTATSTATPNNGGQTCSFAVPAAIYGLAAGSAIFVTLTNSDNAPSTAQSFTSIGIPSGGTITTSGGYRVHTFTSSGTLTVPSQFSASANYLIVAGGAGTGVRHSGGGGGGGLLTGNVTLSASSLSIVVGSGGASSGTTNGSLGGNGSNTSAFGLTAIGGGHGGTYLETGGATNASSGGSGGGCPYGGTSAGSGTAGQGNAGGILGTGTSGGGGGGAGAAGSIGASTRGGDGGAGVLSAIDGNSYYYAGGGGGSLWGGGGQGGNGGIGGGGGGGYADFTASGTGGAGGGSARNSGGNGYTCVGSGNGGGGNGGANTGGGGGGCGQGAFQSFNGTGGSGGSGIVIVRYPLPT